MLNETRDLNTRRAKIAFNGGLAVLLVGIVTAALFGFSMPTTWGVVLSVTMFFASVLIVWSGVRRING